MSDVFGKTVVRKKRVQRKRKGGLTRAQLREVKMEIDKKVDQEVERKTHDVLFNAVVLTTVPQFTDLTALIQGINFNNRIGIRCTIDSIQLKLRFVMGDTTQYIRCVLFQWYGEGSGTPPTWYDIFQYGTGGGGLPLNQSEYMSPFTVSHGTVPLYRILGDFSVTLDVDNVIQQYNLYLSKGFRKMIDFDNTTALSGTGHIYLMIISDSGAVTHPNVSGYSRIRFKDA